ncbi:hypothetical protein GCM10009760_04710 [Kitasatospora kazusensis]|uniref:Uncharacterized protein n=1 Tax=Kitasatospora kazusensis TaxID=407974 RepID=A0ABN2YT29_9ACTN
MSLTVAGNFTPLASFRRLLRSLGAPSGAGRHIDLCPWEQMIPYQDSASAAAPGQCPQADRTRWWHILLTGERLVDGSGIKSW